MDLSGSPASQVLQFSINENFEAYAIRETISISRYRYLEIDEVHVYKGILKSRRETFSIFKSLDEKSWSTRNRCSTLTISAT